MAGVWKLWACENSETFENCGRENDRYIRFRELLKLKNLINNNNNVINYSKNALL